MTYSVIAQDGSAIKYEDERGLILSIPADPANVDYQNFLAWCDEGNEPDPYVAPPAPPEPTPEEKLAASGLTVDELKSLLGIS